MLLRVYDESSKEFSVARIGNVVHSGAKEIFLVTTLDGYQIKCTKDHRFLTRDGWQTLENAVGLQIRSGRYVMTKVCAVLTNGTSDMWRSYDWMKEQRDAGKSVAEIANAAGCSYHNIRKWLKIHKLQFDYTETQFKRGQMPWNKGAKYSFGFTEERRQAWSEKSKRVWAETPKDKHPWWRGGISSDRALIGRWTTSVAPLVHQKYSWTCQLCGATGGRLHAHHVLPVVTHPQWAMEFDNLITVCHECHSILHGKKSATNNVAAQKRKGSRLVGKYSQIASVESIGVEDTYDIMVDGDNHNFVANGFVVHNSGRYTPFQENDFYVPDVWRRQSSDNKQASEGALDSSEGDPLTRELVEHYARSYLLYEKALQMGVSREMARLFLPGFAVYYTGIVKVDAHNLMHFLHLRMAPDAQHEIRAFATAIYEHFFKPALPWTAEAFEKYVLQREEV
jgi:thymidylate synthase (FAD)